MHMQPSLHAYLDTIEYTHTTKVTRNKGWAGPQKSLFFASLISVDIQSGLEAVKS